MDQEIKQPIAEVANPQQIVTPTLSTSPTKLIIEESSPTEEAPSAAQMMLPSKPTVVTTVSKTIV